LVLERLVDHYRRADGLSWMYGQGSVIRGLADDSDLDLILVWNDDALNRSTLPGQSKLTLHGQLALEQSNIDGYDLDLMHVPRRTFETWTRAPLAPREPCRSAPQARLHRVVPNRRARGPGDRCPQAARAADAHVTEGGLIAWRRHPSSMSGK
jgi:hypothetical protein